MGLHSRHKWDARAVEFFRIAKLDGTEKAEAYRATFQNSPEMDKALQRTMDRVVRAQKEMDENQTRSAIGSGLTDCGAVPTSGAPAPVADVGPLSGEPSGVSHV